MRAIAGINLQITDICIGIILTLTPFVLPLFSLLDSNGNIITAATAIFAIVSGFFITDATGNYLRLQTLIAEENASLISISHAIREVIPEKFSEAQKVIDTYMIAQLDIDELDHAIRTSTEFEELISTVGRLVATMPPGNDLLASIQNKKDQLIELNQEITLAAQRNFTSLHWFILFALGGVTGVSMLSIRDGGVLANTIVAAMLLGIEGVLIVLRDMDNNRFLQRKLGFRNPQQVFRALLLPPYYPLSSKMSQRNAGQGGTYRIRNATTSEIISIKLS
jgi:hypothetical protein